ncbi:MAG: hypothetical protein GY749_41925, partial [Desulfobacteraceae bacterium]|nr:hypothetical protein [Desulfobacteraceae bacterium]
MILLVNSTDSGIFLVPMLRVGMQAVALCADISGASVVCQEVKAVQNNRRSEDIRA